MLTSGRWRSHDPALGNVTGDGSADGCGRHQEMRAALYACLAILLAERAAADPPKVRPRGRSGTRRPDLTSRRGQAEEAAARAQRHCLPQRIEWTAPLHRSVRRRRRGALRHNRRHAFSASAGAHRAAGRQSASWTPKARRTTVASSMSPAPIPASATRASLIRTAGTSIASPSSRTGGCSRRRSQSMTTAASGA